MEHGELGTSVLDPHGFIYAPIVKEVNHYWYWEMPAYPLLLTLWSKLFGFHLFTIRTLSVAMGVIALICWFWIISQLTQSRATGCIAILLLATEERFLLSSATGRMDMMCLTLSLAAVAVYLLLRDRFPLAIFASCTLLSLALMTHPNVVVGAVLFVAVLWQDRTKIRWQTVALAAVPFVVTGALWGLYILRRPDVFVAQAHTQAIIPHRFHVDWNLIRQFRYEFAMRFGYSYRLFAESILTRLTALPIIVYFLSVMPLAVIPALRKRPGVKLLLIVTAVDFMILSCLQKNWYYLIYIVSLFAADLAIVVTWLWSKGPVIRVVTALAVAIILALQLSVSVFRFDHNDQHYRYARVIDYLKTHARTNELIMGSGELGFSLGFGDRVLDDCRLGFTSGKAADYIVVDVQYNGYFSWLADHEPATYRYIRRTLADDYERVYDQTNDGYQSVAYYDQPYVVYQKRKGGAAVAR
jgi:hypothetical protein